MEYNLRRAGTSALTKKSRFTLILHGQLAGEHKVVCTRE